MITVLVLDRINSTEQLRSDKQQIHILCALIGWKHERPCFYHMAFQTAYKRHKICFYVSDMKVISAPMTSRDATSALCGLLLKQLLSFSMFPKY